MSQLPSDAARLQASQQAFSELSNTAGPSVAEAALADSLYRSVARQLQSGAGPATVPQVPVSYITVQLVWVYPICFGQVHRDDSFAAR
jgi:hypothetical protein